MVGRRSMKYRGIIKEVFINGLIIFISYILAVFIRYNVLRSDPGINALSTPYLIIASVYSFLIACTFDREEYPRWLTQRSSINSLYRILSKNAIGCLLLLSTFYITGIVYFSRWALILFWVFSTLGLILKREIMYSRIAIRRCKGKDLLNVLVIGEGELMEAYVRSINENPQFGIRIIGYIGQHDKHKIKEEEIFDISEYPEQILKWLGPFDPDALEGIITENSVHEIILAEDIPDTKLVMAVLSVAKSHGIRTNMPIHCGNLIQDGTRIRNLGATKQVALNETVEENSFYLSGMVITASLLFLILIIKKFNMGTMDTMKGFERYRCVISALFGFFMFLTVAPIFQNKAHPVLKRTLLSWIGCTVFIIGYELVYAVNIVQSIQLDILVTTAVLVMCCIAAGFLEMLDQSEIMFLE